MAIKLWSVSKRTHPPGMLLLFFTWVDPPFSQAIPPEILLLAAPAGCMFLSTIPPVSNALDFPLFLSYSWTFFWFILYFHRKVRIDSNPTTLASRPKTESANNSSVYIYIYIYFSSDPAVSWPPAAAAGSMSCKYPESKSPNYLYLLCIFFSLLPSYLIYCKRKFKSPMLHLLTFEITINVSIILIPSTAPMYNNILHLLIC